MKFPEISPTKGNVDPEKKGNLLEGFKFLKPKSDGAKAESPNVRIFTPKKETYENPNELIEEFRTFIQKDLQEGEIVHVSHEHAMQMTTHIKTDKEKEIDQKATEKEGQMAEYTREDIVSVLIEEISLDLLALFGEIAL